MGENGLVYYTNLDDFIKSNYNNKYVFLTWPQLLYINKIENTNYLKTDILYTQGLLGVKGEIDLQTIGKELKDKAVYIIVKYNSKIKTFKCTNYTFGGAYFKLNEEYLSVSGILKTINDKIQADIKPRRKRNPFNKNYDRGIKLKDLLPVLQDISSNELSRWSWADNFRCKYITLGIDTRDGGYVKILDHDGKEISLKELKMIKPSKPD